MLDIVKDRIIQVQNGMVPDGYTWKWHLMPSTWKDVPLSKIFSSKAPKNKGNYYNIVFTNSAEHGIIPQSDYFDKEIVNQENTEGYYIVHPGDYVYNPRISEHAPYGPFKRNDTNITGIVSPLYTVISPRKEFERCEFLRYYLESNQWHKYAYSIANYGARFDRMNITGQDLMELPIALPPADEREKIVQVLAQYDKVIELYQTKLEEIQNLKKGLLKKMFPQKGSNVPEVRFPGFIEPWTQHKVGEIGSVQTCKRIFKEQTSQTGEIPFYKNGTLGIQPDAYISRELFEDYKERYPYPEIGDVMMSVVGSIGRTAEHLDVDEYFQDSNVVWLRTDSNVIDKKFLKVSYQIIDWIIEGSTVKHLYNDNILLSKIWLTSIREQKKIGVFFEKFDNLISMYQNELLEMQTFQRGLKQLLLTGIVRIKV